MSSWKYVVLVAILSSVGVTAIVAVAISNTPQAVLIIASITAFLTPTIGTILAVMVKDIHRDINSRMTELLDITRKQALAEGKLHATNSQNGDFI